MLGKNEMASHPVDLSKICKAFLSDLKKKTGAEKWLETRLPDTGPDVIANAGQVREILENLVTNARESMAETALPGSVCVELAVVRASEIPLVHRFPVGFHPTADTYACIKVMDQGPGVSDGEMENLFDPFYSSKFIGRGLGLALTLSMVTAHEGCITVEKGRKHGTVFQVFFPVKNHSTSME